MEIFMRKRIDMVRKTWFTHLRVLFERQHDFGSSVPPCGYVFRHETSLCARWLGGLDGTCETEVTDLEVAVGVEEEIGGLEIPMNNIRRMQRLQCAECLVDEVLGMVVR